MSLKEKFQKYNKMHYHNMLIIFIMFSVIALEAILGLMYYLSSAEYLFIVMGAVLVILIGLFIYNLKLSKDRKKMLLELDRMKEPFSCKVVGKVSREDYPKVFNILKVLSYSDDIKTYVCKNQDIEYQIIDSMVNLVDEENNMLWIKDFLEASIGDLVTIEFIMKDLVCVVKNDKEEVFLADLGGLDFK